MSAWLSATVGVIATAVWLWPGPEWLLRRIVDPGEPESRVAPIVDADDPFDLAAALDLFALCLRSGLPVESAATIVATAAPPGLARPLTVTADLLSLGADPDHAWRAPLADQDLDKNSTTTDFAALAMMARLSARAGSSFAAGLTELSETIRDRARDDALERSERAGVAISGPLGLCFLPAFVCLGIVPVVIGLAGGVLGS